MGAWFRGPAVPPLRQHPPGLLDVLADGQRPAEVRAQVAEAVAEHLEFSESSDPLRHQAEAAFLHQLDDESPSVRFWAAFGLGKLRAQSAVPRLRALTSDNTLVPRWWTVGQEASDAIDWIEGRVPPGRLPDRTTVEGPATKDPTPSDGNA